LIWHKVFAVVLVYIDFSVARSSEGKAMRYSICIIVGVLTTFVALTGCSMDVSFRKDIRPILQANCISCHDRVGEGIAKSEFSAKDYDSVMRGTKFGPVIVAGSSESSTLYLMVAHKTDLSIHMPPHHEQSLAEGRMKPLSREQIELIKLWIDQGAHNN
jgi:cytochrome c